MEIRKVIEGTKDTMPCGVVSNTKGGWTNNGKVRESGIVVTLNSAEQMVGAVFLTESRLAELGYVRKPGLIGAETE